MVLQLDRVSVKYRLEDGGFVDALVDVDMQVALGESLAITGPNGSGKSALALCLAGLIQPTSGCVIVSESANPSDPIAAIAFQYPDDNLIGETVEEEITLTLEHCGAGTTSTDKETALDVFGLTELRHRPIARLSGGEKQLLALAATAVSGRDLLVLDEPTSHLDPPTRRGLLRRLLSLQGSEWPFERPKPAIVLITQYEDEARQFPRVVELRTGRVIFDGIPASWVPVRPGGSDNPKPSFNLSKDDAPVVLRARDLTQHEQPGRPLPPHPLQDISLAIRAGETIGLCGPVGAGKSTLVYHLANLIESYGGVIEHPGSENRNVAPVVAIQFPERQLFCPTVLEDVAYGPIRQGTVRAEAETGARAAMTRLGLSPYVFAERSPFSLSCGQRRRAALSGVIVCNSPLYILDEPGGALDRSGLEYLERVLADWRTSGVASVIVSHDIVWLRRITSRAWVLHEGRLLYDGSWDDQSRLPEVLQSIGFSPA